MVELGWEPCKYRAVLGVRICMSLGMFCFLQEVEPPARRILYVPGYRKAQTLHRLPFFHPHEKNGCI